MGTATCTITDLETSTGITLELNESGPNESKSPTPSNIGKSYKRALVQHEIPTLSCDIGQDMGANSREYPIDGISLQDVRDTLESFFLSTQFTAANPGGRFQVVMTSSGGSSVLNQSGLAIKTYSWKYVAGMPRWFRYTLMFVEFLGQT